MEQKIRPVQEILRQQISKHSNSVAKKLLPSVRPIYMASDRDSPELIGSGVIIKVENYYFLITAAHLLDQLRGLGMYIGGEKTVVDITGQLIIVATNSGSGDKDKIDFAFTEIPENLLDELGRHNFLPPDEIDPNDIAIREKRYLILGYPISKNKWIDYKGLKVKPKSYPYSSRPSDILIYKELGISEESHLLLDFDKEKVTNGTGNVFIAPDLYGMSGGGVWTLHDDSKALSIFSESQLNKLVGVIIEWDLQKKVIIAVRISIVIAAIIERYPNLIGKLPMPNRIRASIKS